MAKYQTIKKYSRLDFTPLTWSCVLECITPASPVTQTSNSLIGEYEPDRSQSPTRIRPRVWVTDKDDVFPNGLANARLSSDSHVWTLNGKAIKEVWTEGTDYEITKDASDLNGTLVVYRNVSPLETYELAYEGKFNDFRTGTNYVVSASGMALTTSDKGEDMVELSVDASHVVYDQTKDLLLRYEYMAANNLNPTGSRSNYLDGNAYERTVNIVVAQGASRLTSLGNLKMRLVELGKSTALSLSDDRPELKVLSLTDASKLYITFDLRFAVMQEYEVQILDADNNILSRSPISLRRQTTSLSEPPKVRYGQDILPGQQRYYNAVDVNIGKERVPYPELLYHIQWYTQARIYNNTNASYEDAEAIARNAGEKMECDVSSLGLGKTKNDNFMHTYADVYEREEHELLTDREGNILTDGSGNVLCCASIDGI